MKHWHLWIGAVGLFEVAALIGILLLPELPFPLPLFSVFVVLLALIAIPGILSVLLLKLDLQGDPLLCVALGVGLGLGEALVIGRVLLTIGADVRWLGIALTFTTLLKIAALWKSPLLDLRWRIERRELLLLIIPAVLIGVYLFTVARINLALPAYPLSTWDKWTYITVIEQFRVSPADLHLRPESVIFGSNTRVAWNSWVYLQAAVSSLSATHPIQLIFQYFRPAWSVLALAGVYAFAMTLLRVRWLALLGVVLQLLFLMNGTFERYVFLRIEEDKFVAYFLLVPLAWAFALRALRGTGRRDVLGLAVVTCAAGLVHPIGVPGILVTTLPIVAVEGLLMRKSGMFGRIVVVSVVMLIFLILPILDQILIFNTPYVQTYIAEQGDLPSYTPGDLPRIFDQNFASLLLLLAVLPLLFFARKDSAARVLLVISLTCLSVMLIPLFAALMSRLVTTVAMERWNWLLPSGVVLAYVISKLSEGRPKRQVILLSLGLVIAVCTLLIVSAGWQNWRGKTRNLINAGEPGKPISEMPEFVWDAFLATAEFVGDARAVAPVEYGVAVPSLWSNADVLVYNARSNASEAWDMLEGLYNTGDLLTAEQIITEWQIVYLLVPHDRPLYTVLATNAGFVAIYESDHVTVFRVDDMQ